MESMSPAWYLMQSSNPIVRFLNSLHIPYTILHLSLVALGCVLATQINWLYFVLILGAFFCAMGVSSHHLDLLQGDPLRLGFSRKFLWIVAALGFVIAVSLGTYYVYLDRWYYFIIFIVVGPLLACSYNLEWFRGKLHNDNSFAFFWGVFPFLCGYLVQNHTMTPVLILGAIFCYLVARIQRVLSWRVRFVRRRMDGFFGVGFVNDKCSLGITREWLIEADEKALALLCFAIPVLVVVLALWR